MSIFDVKLNECTTNRVAAFSTDNVYMGLSYSQTYISPCSLLLQIALIGLLNYILPIGKNYEFTMLAVVSV